MKEEVQGLEPEGVSDPFLVCQTAGLQGLITSLK